MTCKLDDWQYLSVTDYLAMRDWKVSNKRVIPSMERECNRICEENNIGIMFTSDDDGGRLYPVYILQKAYWKMVHIAKEKKERNESRRVRLHAGGTGDSKGEGTGATQG